MKTIRVGSPAPAFALRAADGHQGPSLDAFAGETVILAFVDGWRAEDAEAADVARLRGQVRRLGAVLVVVSDGATWCVRGDDGPELFDNPIDARQMALAYEAPAGRAGVVLFVIGPGGVVWLVVRRPHRRGWTRSLGDALAEVRRAPLDLSSLATRNRRAWVLSSFVGGLALSFLLDRDHDRRPDETAALHAR